MTIIIRKKTVRLPKSRTGEKTAEEALRILLPFSVFSGRHAIGFFEQAHEVLRTFVANQLADGRQGEIGLTQRAAGLTELDVFDDLYEGASGTFPDQSAEMGSTVAKMGGCFVQCGGMIIPADIV